VELDYLSKFPSINPKKKFTTDAILPYIKEEDLFHCFGVPEVL